MPLTRGDKIIIGSAVALAAAVVLGLAALKKPFLFGNDAATQPASVEPAPATMTPGPPPGAMPVTAPPTAAVAPVAPAPAATAPPAAPPAPPAPAATPATPVVTGKAPDAPAKTPAGDETLDKMFADITRDTPSSGKTDEPQAATTESNVATPPGSVPVVVTNEPKAAPAAGPKAADQPATPPEAAPAPTKAAKAAAKKAKMPPPAQTPPPAKDKEAKTTAKPQAEAKSTPKSGATSGNVIRLVAEDKAGEYVLTVQTSTPPAHYEKMFLNSPPRMVLDLNGSWTYTGATSQATGQQFIRQIRVGRHADLFRVVLDMGPEALSQLRGTPTLERGPQGVTLRIPK